MTSGEISYGLNTQAAGAVHPVISRGISSIGGLHSEVVALNRAFWARGAGPQSLSQL